MAKTITLSLQKDLIFEAVKAETYDTGRINKAADPIKNAPVAMIDQAGGEQHQERQMLRSLKQAVGKFEAQMAEFLDAGAGTINDTLSGNQSAFNITMVVSDRYNNGLAKPMSSLCEDYLINQMLFSWWNSRDQKFANQFIVNAQDSIEHVRLCLAKSAPASSPTDYTDVTGNVTNN